MTTITSPGPTAVPPGRGLRIAMALYSDVTYDSRVLREAETLGRAGHSVTVYCLSGAAPPGARFEVVAHTPGGSAVLPDGSSPFLRASSGSVVARIAARLRWMAGYWRTVRAWGHWVVAAAGDVDAWHAHDLTGLMAVGPLVGSTPLVYDSHEIFIETGSGVRLPKPMRRLLVAYEGRLARRAVALVTVNEGYAKVLERRLRPRRTILVRNCPPRWTPSPAAGTRLREAAGVPASTPVALYHGMFGATRGIEQLVDALLVPGLESVHVALLGYGSTRPRLEELAAEPRFGGRLHVLDPVPPAELLDWVAGADVDVIPLQRGTLNHWYCTPNKLWESLAVGVPVVVSDFPMMHRVVLDDPSGRLGSVCEPGSPESIAAAIRAIVEAPAHVREALRARCLQAAHERWNWETESARLVELYAELSGPA